jgi:hypothetical protein
MWGYQPHDQPGSSHLIRPSETSVSKARYHLVAEQVKRGWEMGAEFCRRVPIVLVEFFYMHKICDMGPTALLPLRRKAWILSPLKSTIDLSRVWTRTLGPVANTLTTRPPRATPPFISLPYHCSVQHHIQSYKTSVDKKALLNDLRINQRL